MPSHLWICLAIPWQLCNSMAIVESLIICVMFQQHGHKKCRNVLKYKEEILNIETEHGNYHIMHAILKFWFKSDF